MRRFLGCAALVAGLGGLLSIGAPGVTAVGSTVSAAALPIIRLPHPGGVSNSSVPTISLNWSGYAVTSPSKFTYVHSEFVQPALKCVGKPDQFDSNWVGFDGFQNGTVEQDGTLAFCGGPTNMTARYFGWIEMFPAPLTVVFKTRPGDVIDATVSYRGGQFRLKIADLSTGRSATTVATCSDCRRASAEWIDERFAECNPAGTKCFLGALADFRSVTMTDNIASLAGRRAKGITGFANNYPIDMVTPLKHGFISLDTVGPVNPKTDAFTVTWDRSGQPVPITLGRNR
jgi:hypothetical protein